MAERTRAARGREAAGIAADCGGGAKMAAARRGEGRGDPWAGSLRVWGPGARGSGAGHPGRSGFSLGLDGPPAWQLAVAAQRGALPVGFPAPLGFPEVVPVRAGGADSPRLAALPHAAGRGVDTGRQC